MTDVQDRFFDDLASAFAERFGVAITTEWGIFSMRNVTSRVDEEPLTEEQHRWIADYEGAWLKGEAAPRTSTPAS